MRFSRANADLHVRYDSILFPFNIESLIQKLPSLGYILTSEASRAITNVPFQGGLGISGKLATKGDITFWVGHDRNSLGMLGSDCKMLVEEMEALEKLISEEVKFSSQENALFYEMQYEVTVESEANPLDAIEKQFSGLPIISEMSDILANPVTNFAFRLVPLHMEPNIPDWFEVRIEPQVLQPTKFWLVHILYRNQDRNKTFEISENALSLAERLLFAVER